MTSRVEEILRQFMQLNGDEKAELMHRVQGQLGRGSVKSRGNDIFGESLGHTTVNFAPAPGTCPRCGK